MVYIVKKIKMISAALAPIVMKFGIAACVGVSSGCAPTDNEAQAQASALLDTQAILDEKSRKEREKPVVVNSDTNSAPMLATASRGSINKINPPSPGPAPAPGPTPGPIPAPAPISPVTQGAMPGATLGTIKNPILFVTQIPVGLEFASRVATFANHMASPKQVPRGGDLMIRYPDGVLRNLTKEAGFGQDGLQGANAIAVREPSVHWSGTKALFSMLIGSPKQYSTVDGFWQIYEISGLGKGEQVKITKVANQPASFNNVSPLYGTDEKVLFTSDRPRNGALHLYPQLDEYESNPTVTGIWSLEPTSGALKLLAHSVSGSYSPIIDSSGRIVYTRWDHLQTDQQAEADRAGLPGGYGAYSFDSEALTSVKVALKPETFPEPRFETMTTFGRVGRHLFNQFTPWQVNEDGTDEETLNHFGRQEYNAGYVPRSFLDDPALVDSVTKIKSANTFYFQGSAGIFQMREDPNRPGRFFGVYSNEFGSVGTGILLTFDGTAGLNPESMALVPVSAFQAATNESLSGRFRNPLPLSDGQMVATYTPANSIATSGAALLGLEMRLRQLVFDKATGRYSVMSVLTGGGIQKTVSWYDPDTVKTWSGTLWELEPVELVARVKPVARTKPLDAPEQQVFTEEGVDPAAMQAWLKKNELALIVTRNQTSRDISDRQQPFNLQVPGGVRNMAPDGGKIYNIANFQVFQADQTRGYTSVKAGRRPIATPMHGTADKNVANPTGPIGSVKIAADGSTAVIVPAQRSLAWQTTDAAGNAVVRERVWVSFQSGEIRVCASCHGVNSKDQAGAGAPVNRPEALRELLKLWKTLPK
jgi:Hydrazine synthase alpha subunit middle domain